MFMYGHSPAFHIRLHHNQSVTDYFPITASPVMFYSLHNKSNYYMNNITTNNYSFNITNWIRLTVFFSHLTEFYIAQICHSVFFELYRLLIVEPHAKVEDI